MADIQDLTFEENYFDSADSVHRCRYIAAIPKGEIKGAVQISHGMCEYIDRYRDFMAYLAQNGFAAFGNDHLGHGKTAADPADLGYFSPENGWQNAVADLHTLTKIMKKRFPALPFFMVGHSMGSFLARAYALRHGSECRAFVFIGTADGFESAAADIIEKGAGFAGRLTSKLTGKETNLGRAAITAMLTQGEILKKVKGERYRSELLNKLGFGRNNERIENCRTEYDWISRDEEIVEKYAADELCTFVFTVNGFINLAEVLWYVSNDKWYTNLRKDLPLLLLAGDADPVGNYGKGVRSVYEKLCEYRCDASMKLYEGARHELLNELCREEVYGDILEFISANLFD